MIDDYVNDADVEDVVLSGCAGVCVDVDGVAVGGDVVDDDV